MIPYATEIKYDSILQPISIPALAIARCQSCGEIVFSNDAQVQINAALRSRLRLLQPEEIRAERVRLGITLAELSDRLGVSEQVVSDWEEDIAIQPRVVDNLLRVYFALPEARAILVGNQVDSQVGLLVG